MSVVDDLLRAREAFERREWVAAYDALSDLEDTRLQADDFAALATTAYLLGRRNDCVQALQRAFQVNLEDDVPLAAVRSAYWLAMVLITGGEPAIGGGWIARAQRILDDIDEDVVERGYIMIHLMFRHIFAGEFAQAHELAMAVTDYGRRFHDPDLVANGLNAQGRLLIHCGQVREGLQLLDEAMVGVVAGEVTTIFAGQVYCSMIEACQWICDFGRAGEWTRALTNWCASQPGLVAFTGQCAVHRGQLMRLHGHYTEALDELQNATVRYAAAGGGPAAGLAHQERGEVLRILGDFDAAEAAYEEAVRYGNEAQPGRALLWLAQGRTDSAVATARRIAAESGDPVERNRLIPAAIDILIETGHVDEAEPLVQELTAIAESFGCTALRAAAGHAVGRRALVRGNANAALPALRSAVVEWTELDAPYERARCRASVGAALRLLGDEESGLAELDAARRTFAELGAKPAERELAELLGNNPLPAGLTPRELQVLGLVAAGRSNAEIAADLHLSGKTVARHLSNIYGKLDVNSRTAAAAFAYEHRLV